MTQKLLNKKCIIMIVLSLLMMLMLGGVAFGQVTQDDLLDGLVSYYKFDETSGTVAVDSHGTNDATLSSSDLITTNGKINNGININGVSEAGVNSNYELSIGSSYSFGGWFKASNTRNNDVLFAIEGIEENRYIYLIRRTDSSQQLSIQSGISGSTQFIIETGEDISDTEFSHIFVTKNNDDFKIFINGVEAGSGTREFDDVDSTFMIGSREAYSLNFRGSFDEVLIYNRSLSSDEINTTYQIQKDGNESGQYPFTALIEEEEEGIFKDLISSWSFNELDENNKFLDLHGDYNLTPSNVRVEGGDGIINDGADFTKGDDYIETENINLHQGFSISSWFKTSNTGEGLKTLFTQYVDPSVNSFNIYLENGYAKFIIYGTGSSGNVITSNDVYNDGDWHHIVAVYDGESNYSLYINNVNVGNQTVTSAKNQNIPLRIGARLNSDYFNGYIDETNLFSRAINETEISLLYNNGAAIAYPFEATEFIVTAKSLYDDSPIKNFTIKIDDTIYTTTNYSITTHLLLNDTSLYNLEIYNLDPQYFPQNVSNLAVNSSYLALINQKPKINVIGIDDFCIKIDPPGTTDSEYCTVTGTAYIEETGYREYIIEYDLNEIQGFETFAVNNNYEYSSPTFLATITPEDDSGVEGNYIDFTFSYDLDGNSAGMCYLNKVGESYFNSSMAQDGTNTLRYYHEYTGVVQNTYELRCSRTDDEVIYTSIVSYNNIIVDNIPGTAKAYYSLNSQKIDTTQQMVYYDSEPFGDEFVVSFVKDSISLQDITVYFNGSLVRTQYNTNSYTYTFNPSDLDEDTEYTLDVIICDLVRCTEIEVFSIYKPKLEISNPPPVLQGKDIIFYLNLTYKNNYGLGGLNWTLDKFTLAQGGDYKYPQFTYNNQSYTFEIDSITEVDDNLVFQMSKEVLSAEIDTTKDVENNTFSITSLRLINCVYCPDFGAGSNKDKYYIDIEKSLNVTIYPSGVDNCSTYNYTLLTFIAEKEKYNTNNSLNFTLNLDFWFTTDDVNLEQSFAFTDNNNYSICVRSPGEYTYNFVSEYFAEGYSERTYYAEDITTSTENNETITLYLLENDDSSIILFKVFDKFTLEPYNNVYIKVYRYYPELAQYKLVEVSKTNANGEASGNLELYSTFYRFNLEKPMGNILSFEGQEPSKILSTLKTFPITSDAINLNEWYTLQDATFSVLCNEKTNICSMTWSSTTDKTGSLTLTKKTGSTRTLIDSASAFGTGATIYVEIISLENGSVYEAVGTLTSASGETRSKVDSINMLARLSISAEDAQQFMIPMIMAMIMITFLLINFGPVGVILGSTLAFAVGAFLYLIPLPTYMVAGSGVFGIITLALILIYKMSK